MENFFIDTHIISIASFENYKEATFLISVLDEPDLYGRIIPQESGELYHDTIVGYPLVAKLKKSLTGKPVDFGGHERVFVLEDGKRKSKFNTVAIGSFTESAVVPMEVDGYDGEKNCIIAKCKLWTTRFPEYFKVFDKLWDEGNLKSSWEMSVSESEEDGNNKILKTFEFIGAAALGKRHIPAVQGGGVIQYAEFDDDNDTDLADALEKDICVLNENVSKKEDIDLDKVNNKPTTETASLTQWDLQDKITKACEVVLDKRGYVSYWFPAENTAWFVTYDRESELDYIVFTYTVENDEVTVSEPQEAKLTVSIADVNAVTEEKDKEIGELKAELEIKDNAIIQAGETINGLKAKIAELEPYKEAADKAEKERIETEIAEHKEALRNNMRKNNLFTEEEIASAEIAELIEARDEVAIKTLIADRYIASFDKMQKETSVSSEVAEVEPEVDTAIAALETDDVEDNPRVIMQSFLKMN